MWKPIKELPKVTDTLWGKKKKKELHAEEETMGNFEK